MDIDVRCCCTKNPSLVDILQKNTVSYRDGENRIVFHFKESHPNFQVIEQAAKEAQGTIIRSRVYTKQEMDHARWFYMRSKCGKISITEESSFEYSCRQTFYYQGIELNKWKHCRQIAPVHTKKTPKWKPKNNFYSIDTGDFWSIFCSDFAKETLLQNTNGLEFMPVLKGKTDKPLEDIHQLSVPKKLPLEALEFDGQITVSSCPYCGKPLYEPICPGTFIPRVRSKYLSDQCDYYATETQFGPGLGHSMYIVSRKVYETAVKNLNERNLVFMPIEVF